MCFGIFFDQFAVSHIDDIAACFFSSVTHEMFQCNLHFCEINMYF